MYYKSGFTLVVDEDVDTDVVKMIFTIKDVATGRMYPWDISPYSNPTMEEFANRIEEIIEAIVE